MAIKKSFLFVFILLSLSLLSTSFSLEDNRRYSREEGSEEEEWESEWESENNPFIFDQQRLRTHIDNDQGRLRVLERLGRKSELLRGIRNYNVALLEVRPNALLIPNHLDADAIIFVASGRAAITLVHRDRRETHNLERGDVFVLPAGTTFYLFNRDNNRNLRIIKLLRSTYRNDRVRPFFGPGGRNPRSYYQAFSRDIIEAALNTQGERWERVFNQQDQGGIVRASEQQIRAMSRESSSERGRWPFGGRGESSEREHFNLFEQRPSHGNNHGQLYEARPEGHRQLEELNIGVSYANISSGSIFGPYYNSRATNVVVVVKGRAHVQIACPHLSREQGERYRRGSHYREDRGSQEWEEREGQGRGSHGEEGNIDYQRVSADLSADDIFIVPAGHPVVTVASENQNENLQIVWFDINAENNQRYPLAGEGNVMLQLDDQAQELSFNQDSRVVQEMFGSQPRTFFFPGRSERRQGEGRASE